VPDADTVVPLCSYANFTEGAFADLVSGFSQSAVNDILIEATRQCEDLTQRRLAPFTVTETARASGIDPDEYAATSNIPTSIQGALGMSEAQALSVTNLVRHHWLREYPPRYQELWTYSNVAVTVFRSYGGNQAITTGQIIMGPDEAGHVWFQLGQFIPVASYIQVQYSGGYTVATPGSLVRASKYLAASIAVTELNPEDTEHDPNRLYSLALRWLGPFGRDGSMAQQAVVAGRGRGG
jgi:hypothetical protein